MGLLIYANRHQEVVMKKLCLFCLVMFVFLGCKSTSPLVNTFMDSDYPVMDHAVLSVHLNMKLGYIDGQFTSQSMGSEGMVTTMGKVGTKEPAVILTPGKHKLYVAYVDMSKSSYESGSVTYIVTKETSTDFVTIYYDFMGGHFYRIYPEFAKNVVSFKIIDETDPNVWQIKREGANALKRVTEEKKMLASANYPPIETASLRIQKAMASNPTLIEGEWKSNAINPQRFFTFTGKVFTTNAKENELRRGLFDLGNNTLELSTLEISYNDGLTWENADLDQVSNELNNVIGPMGIGKKEIQKVQAMLAAIKTEQKMTVGYVYTFNPDGILELKKDNEGTIIFTREK